MFDFQEKIAGQTGDDWTKDVEIMVQLKCLNNFREIFETPLINYEIDLFWLGL